MAWAGEAVSDPRVSDRRVNKARQLERQAARSAPEWRKIPGTVSGLATREDLEVGVEALHVDGGRCLDSNPAWRPADSVSSGSGESHTSLPPGTSTRMTWATKAVSSSRTLPSRAIRRPIGGLVRTRVTPGGERERVAEPEFRVELCRFQVLASGSERARSRSEPSRRRWGRGALAPRAPSPLPTKGSQTTSSLRAPATRASAARERSGAEAVAARDRRSARPRPGARARCQSRSSAPPPRPPRERRACRSRVRRLSRRAPRPPGLGAAVASRAEREAKSHVARPSRLERRSSAAGLVTSEASDSGVGASRRAGATTTPKSVAVRAR